jgi:hypothetical protein
VQHLRAAAEKARSRLDQAKGAVVAAEAHAPLVPVQQLEAAGGVVPKVLVRGAHGTALVAPGAAGAGGSERGAGRDAGGSGAGDSSGDAEGAGGVVAVPDAEARAKMYKADEEETGACERGAPGCRLQHASHA